MRHQATSRRSGASTAQRSVWRTITRIRSHAPTCFVVAGASIAWLISVRAASAQCSYEVEIVHGPPCGGFGYAPIVGTAINGNGDIVGFYDPCGGGSSRPFLWTREGGLQLLPPLDVPLEGGMTANDINDNRVIVGAAAIEGLGYRGFILEDGEYTILPPVFDVPGATSGVEAIGISEKPRNYPGRAAVCIKDPRDGGSRMERVNAQPGFVDGMTADLGGPRTAALLERLDGAVPWETLAEPVRTLYRNGVQGGRRPWPAILMLKSLMLAKWFGLSDPQLEECLRDRLSFRRFVGLALHDETPDETTFVTFRRRLREAQVHDELFDRAVSHLEKKGVLVRTGTLVDATIIEAPRGKKRGDGTNTRDEDASFTKKHGRTYHGYKGHVAVDRSGVVTDYRFSTAKDHDSRYIDDLTINEKTAVYADSAYMDQKREAELKRRGVFYGVVRRRKRGQEELPAKHVKANRKIASIRAVVEHPFAWIRQMGLRRTRYRGKERNAFDFAVLLIAYNFKRSLSLSSAQ